MRELHRSYYHAEEYDYPIALGTLPDGRDVLVHRPDHYDNPVVEDAATGERRVLSAGWEWHPFGQVWVFDLAAALAEAVELDGIGRVSRPDGLDGEVVAACWLDGDRVVSLCGHPRLVDAATGAFLAEWPEVRVSRREGSYGVTHVPTPVAALHPDGTRLAVAVRNGTAVLALPQT